MSRSEKIIGSSRYLVLILIVSTLILAACSGGSDAGTPTAAAAQNTSAPQSSSVPLTGVGTAAATQLAGTVLPPPTIVNTAPPTATTLSTAASTAVATPPTDEPTLAATAVQPGPTRTVVPAATAAPTKPASPANATTFPDPSGYQWKQIVTGLAQPVGMTLPMDGSGRLFVIEKGGVIRLIARGALQSQPYLDLRDRVNSIGSEQGLLGLAFDPKFTQNGFFYVNYIDVNGNTVISRFHADPRGASADPGSEQAILRVQQPFPNHNGGQLAFGPDGYLYIGLGDGGSEGDPNNVGQNLDTPLAKILRIDVSKGSPYSIPPGNPFANSNHVKETWDYGLRNPWRFSFDKQTGDLYIGDVGQNTWEEIDFLPAGTPGGVNFGWSYMEGNHPYKGQPPAGVTLAPPVYEYSHDNGCAVTGGYVYRGTSLPAFQGIYIFGDFCSGLVWGLLRSGNAWQGQQLFNTGAAISSFGQDESGEIYLVDINGSISMLAKK